MMKINVTRRSKCYVLPHRGRPRPLEHQARMRRLEYEASQ
jgi:hypothetical protein